LCLRALEHYNYPTELMVAFFPSFPTPTPRNTADIAARTLASLSSPSPHPSTAAPPALTPPLAPAHPRAAVRPISFPTRTPERRRAILPGRRLWLAVGRPTQTSPTPSKTPRRLPSTPSCFPPLLPRRRRRASPESTVKVVSPALTPARGYIASIQILLGSFMQSFSPFLYFKSVKFKNV
jgi:hypothetical protein